jgi:hypothetical protein
MATHTAIGSTDNEPTADDDCVPLTAAELDRIAAAGGDHNGGIGPGSRDNLLSNAELEWVSAAGGSGSGGFGGSGGGSGSN